jgi:ABC-type branched-subunit amino acid transport system substrate-binding protein
MNELHKCIFQALRMLIEADEDLIRTQPKEECINHKLAQYLETVLKKRNLLGTCSVDIEYNKYKADAKKIANGRNIRPDIIAHERKSGNASNLIVIEAKKNYDNSGDRQKVKELMDSQDYQYSAGAVISYFPRKPYIKIKFYVVGEWKKFFMNKTNFSISESSRQIL